MIELWISNETDVNYIVDKAPCVPRVGETIDTSAGPRRVAFVKYDFHPSNGKCRIHIRVENH